MMFAVSSGHWFGNFGRRSRVILLIAGSVSCFFILYSLYEVIHDRKDVKMQESLLRNLNDDPKDDPLPWRKTINNTISKAGNICGDLVKILNYKEETLDPASTTHGFGAVRITAILLVDDEEQLAIPVKLTRKNPGAQDAARADFLNEMREMIRQRALDCK